MHQWVSTLGSQTYQSPHLESKSMVSPFGVNIVEVAFFLFFRKKDGNQDFSTYELVIAYVQATT